MKNKSKIIINLIIIFVVLSLVLYFSLKDNYQEIIDNIKNMNIIWLIISIIILIISRIFSAVSSYQMTKANDYHISLPRAIQINLIIPFFHGVTPFAGGGQPMEIYYLHNEKIPLGKSTNIVLQNFIVYQTALIIISLIAVIYNAIFDLFPANSLIKQLVIVGFIINFLVWLFTLLVSLSKKFNQVILKITLFILKKFNKPALKEKITRYLSNLHKNATTIIKHKKSSLLSLFANILSLICLYSIPYLVLTGMGITNLNIIETIVATSYIMIMGSFVPIPGGTGGLEYGYMYFFNYLIGGSILTSSMLVWRFVSYYLAMIIGAIVLALYRKKENKCV